MNHYTNQATPSPCQVFIFYTVVSTELAMVSSVWAIVQAKPAITNICALASCVCSHASELALASSDLAHSGNQASKELALLALFRKT